MARQELRPKPAGYKKSGRPFNELEQTPGYIGYKQPGTPQYRKFYSFAAKIFDAEAHHIVDLGYIDKMLYKAGFTSGANNTVDFSAARERIIQKLRDNGIDVGNVEENIAPLSRAMPKYNKTGIAHTAVHNAYNAIPEADDSFLRTLNEDQFVSYLVEKTRQRKDYVVQALENKYNALMESHPELKGQSDTNIRKWIQDNPQEFGSLGDDTLKFTRRSPAPVPDQLRGRVSIDPQVNRLFRASGNNYLGTLPIPDPLTTTRMAVQNKLGVGLGAVGGVIADPEAIADALEGDYKGAAENIATGAVTGGIAQTALSMAPAAVQQTAGKVVPVLAGASLFAEGREGSATHRIVNKAAEFVPGLKADPETDIGKRTFDALRNEVSYIRNKLSQGVLPYFN
jgi:hypothetical protein